MPVPKRYFHVSQELNHDPELWAFTDRFGDRALRTWLQILVFLDRSENQWRLVPGWEKNLGRMVRQQPKTVSSQVEELQKNGWLTNLNPEKNDSVVILTSPNWWKYNKRREHKGSYTAPSIIPSLPTPILSHPSPIPTPKIEEKKSMPLRATVDDVWIEELKQNPAYQHINFSVQFGKMDAWLALPANRHRQKTRRFVLNWLNKIESPLRVSTGIPCQARVNDGRFLKPCGKPSTAGTHTNARCDQHGGTHDY